MSSALALEASRLCSFALDGRTFGIDILATEEVVRARRLTPVPLAAPDMAGLLNLRGRIVSSIDLRLRLGLSPRQDGEPCTHIIARTSTGSVSLLVDRVEDVVDVAASQLEPPPHNLPEAARGAVAGVIKLETRLLLVLDVERTACPPGRTS